MDKQELHTTVIGRRATLPSGRYAHHPTWGPYVDQPMEIVAAWVSDGEPWLMLRSPHGDMLTVPMGSPTIAGPLPNEQSREGA